MSKRTYESGSNKRKKATAKADALRAVLAKTKPIAQFFNVAEGSSTPVDSSENWKYACSGHGHFSQSATIVEVESTESIVFQNAESESILDKSVLQ